MSETSLDYLGRFKDEKLQEEYVLYCLEQRSKLSFATIAIVILIWSIAESIVYTWFSDDDHGEVDRDIDEVYGTISLCLAAVGLVLCGILHYSSFNFQNRLVYSYLQVILIFTMNALFIIRATKQIHIGSSNCIPSEYSPLKLIYSNLPDNFSSSDLSTLSNLLQAVELPAQCPSSNSYLSLVNYFSVFVMCFNYQILTAIIYEPRLYIVWGCNLPTTALMLCSVFTSFYTLIPLLTGFLVVAFLLGELHYQRVQSFLNQRKILQLLDENEKNADAKQAMEMRHMISNIAHDLKTPLASFTNGLDLIQDILISTPEKLASQGFENEASLRDCFSSIQTSLTNIRNTNAFMLMSINRCLDYTKASKGMKLKPKYETVNLREVLQFPIECMSNIQERIGIQVEKVSEEICSHIITDKQWLQENILCLLSNAVKYSTEGTVKITVALTSGPTDPRTYEMKSLSKQSTGNLKRVIPTISSCDSECERSNSLLFEVEDTGIGLSEEAAKNLFNPFKQAQRLAGGTGLGLYSLAKRMEALKGGYGVRKRKDRRQGSLFWFSIPYKPDYTLSSITHDHVALEQPLFVKNDRSLSSNCNPSPYEGLDILLVDDAPSILKMSSMMLKRQNHHISVAENGEIALRRIEEKWKQSGKGFDVVLMDLQMPVMDGLEATRRLRKMEAEGRDWMVRAIPVSSRSSDFHEICERSKTVSKHPTHQLIIGLSANSDHETTIEALEAGVDDFFAKPFSINTFNRMVEKFLH